METTVTSELCGAELKISIIGEIDHHSARSSRQKIDELLYYYRPKTVALDLSSITFMDSSGLGLILGRFTLARELGGVLRIVDPTDEVMRILDLAGTSRLISIERTTLKGSIK